MLHGCGPEQLYARLFPAITGIPSPVPERGDPRLKKPFVKRHPIGFIIRPEASSFQREAFPLEVHRKAGDRLAGRLKIADDNV